MPHAWVIITGASGAGKDALTKAVRKHFPNSGKVLTSTTRKPRVGETNGSSYNFYSRKEFERRVMRGEFIEYVEVHGSLYGTRHADLNSARHRYNPLISIMDPFGARDMLQKFPDARTVFVDAPKEELRRRLLERGDSKSEVAVRMKTRRVEVLLKKEFGLYLQNIEFAQAERELIGYITEWCSDEKNKDRTPS